MHLWLSISMMLFTQVFKNKEYKIYPPEFSVTLFLHRPDDQSDAAEMVVPAAIATAPSAGGGGDRGSKHSSGSSSNSRKQHPSQNSSSR